jgi:hypothetical protein
MWALYISISTRVNGSVSAAICMAASPAAVDRVRLLFIGVVRFLFTAAGMSGCLRAQPMVALPLVAIRLSAALYLQRISAH